LSNHGSHISVKYCNVIIEEDTVMKILVTGGSGFVGTYLAKALIEKGANVTSVGSRPTYDRIIHERFRYLSADTTKPGTWQDEVTKVDAVINLTGVSIVKRWTPSYKQKMYDTRILTTRHLVEAMPDDTSLVFCSTSAIGYYRNAGDSLLTEDAPNGNHFLARLCRDWEKEALKAEAKGARVILPRFGVVLGEKGGILAQMLPAFRMFVGGPLGNGRQWFPWIHIEDLTRAMLFVMDNALLKGAFNFCAPHPLRNRDLTRVLGEVLKRPTFMATPGFVLKMVMGEFGEFMLYSQRAVPKRLLENGFQFKYEYFRDAVLQVIDN
jgi:uncharacterized protein (TIGR01777 family)